jgi:chromate transporter
VQGLGLAESTPGPLIMVTQYVGFIGAWNDPGTFSPLLYGTLGALITTYATFLPCFLFIFLLASYIELLANDRRLKAILVGVTAAVVGVVANLAVYFATHVLFPDGMRGWPASTSSRWWSRSYRLWCCNATRSPSTSWYR